MTDLTPEPDDLPARLEAALTGYTELGNPFSEMRRHEQAPDGWPASRPVGPHHVAEVLRELLAAVSVPPSADQTALRDRIAEVLWPLTDWDGDQLNAEAAADAVLVVLPEQTDRAALLRAHAALAEQAGRDQRALARIRQMADAWEQRLPEVIRTPAVVSAIRAALERVNGPSRVAAEEQPAETQARPPCPDPIECGHEAALGLAEMRLDKIREKATEWTALAPPDDWGNTPQDTALADVGRYLLRLIETTPPTARPAVGEQPETQEADRG